MLQYDKVYLLEVKDCDWCNKAMREQSKVMLFEEAGFLGEL